MDEAELSRLHDRADLLGIIHHDQMTAEQLRIAVRERERGADPHQAETAAGEAAQAEES